MDNLQTITNNKHDEIIGIAREAVRHVSCAADLEYLEDRINTYIAEIVEDPDRVIQGKLIPDGKLSETLKDSLGKPLSDDDLLQKPARLLLDARRRRAILRVINENRFLDGHIQRTVVPDGHGSCFIDTIGTPGSWEVLLRQSTHKITDPASVIRIIDSLCDIIYNKDIAQDFGELGEGFIGKDNQIVIVDEIDEMHRDASRQMAVESLSPSTAPERVRFLMTASLLSLSRADMRGFLRDTLPLLRIHVQDSINHKSLSQHKPEAPHDQNLPGVVLLDYAGTSGPHLVGHALEMNGIPTQILKPGGKLTLENPDIFCVSLAMQPPGMSEIGDVFKALQALIDENFPDAFIIVGGPSAKHYKSVVTLFPEINILLRGDGEHVLPEVVKIIGHTKTKDGLRVEQVQALKKIDGLYLHTPGHMLFNNLDKVNIAADFDVPVMFHYGTCSLYAYGLPVKSKAVINPDIARGCPFKCTFCSMAMGCKQRYVAIDKFQQHVLGMLALELPLPSGTEEALAVALGAAGSVPEDRHEWFPADGFLFSREQISAVIRILDQDLSTYLRDRQLLPEQAHLAVDQTADELDRVLERARAGFTRSQINAVIVIMRRRWLHVLLDSGEDLFKHGLGDKLCLVLEDDNTLVNNRYMESFCHWIIEMGLNRYFWFSAGQTGVSSFLAHGEPNETFIRLLHEAGCREVEMGVDGLCNNVLRQNGKSGYKLGDAMRLVVTLARNGISAASNRLYTAPYASALDVVESLIMGALAPLGGRSLGGPFIITVPGSQYYNELVVNRPYWAASRAEFAVTYGKEYEYAWAGFPEYIPLELHLYPFDPAARAITEQFEPLIKIERAEKYFYDRERNEGRLTHELAIIDALANSDLQAEIDAVILTWQAPDQEDEELKALGAIIKKQVDEGQDKFTVFRDIIEYTCRQTSPMTFSEIKSEKVSSQYSILRLCEQK